MIVCRRCLSTLRSQSSLDKHVGYCHEKAQRIILPTKDEDDVLAYGPRQKSYEQECDFVFYADFESVLEPQNDPD